MNLNTGAAVHKQRVTRKDIQDAFEDDLLRGDSIILHTDDNNFLQALGKGDGPYLLQYGDRASAKQYQAVERPAKEQIKEAFLAFLAGDTTWPTTYHWVELDVEEPSFQLEMGKPPRRLTLGLILAILPAAFLSNALLWWYIDEMPPTSPLGRKLWWVSLAAILVAALGTSAYRARRDYRASSLLQKWAHANRLEILHMETCRFFRGAFSEGLLEGRTARPVYYVRVRDQEGQERTGWVRCGNLWAGMLNDKTEVRWEEDC